MATPPAPAAAARLLLHLLLLRASKVAVKVMPKQRGKLTKERTLQKLAKEVGG
jgi:hypothetical protein